MKYLICLLMSCFIFSIAEAKYVYPKGAKTGTERRVDKRMKRYDSDGDGELSFEDYLRYREPRTREERRVERREKKKGTYVSPQEAFTKMDTDEDGVVTREEMLNYENSLLK